MKGEGEMGKVPQTPVRGVGVKAPLLAEKLRGPEEKQSAKAKQSETKDEATTVTTDLSFERPEESLDSDCIFRYLQQFGTRGRAHGHLVPASQR